MRVVQNFKATEHEVIESSDKVVLYVCLFSRCVCNRIPVYKVKEFVDSKLSLEFFPRERKRQEEAAKEY